MVENFEKAFPVRIIVGEASFFRKYCRKAISSLSVILAIPRGIDLVLKN
jgi:hypothetical protein